MKVSIVIETSCWTVDKVVCEGEGELLSLLDGTLDSSMHIKAA